MIKVAALTSGKHFPSSRFRIRQFIEPLQSFGIHITEHYPLTNKYYTKRLVPVGMLQRLPGLMAARRAEVTLFERELVPGKLTLERFAGTKRVLDIDDALWLNAPHFSESLANVCEGVIAGNSYIADHYQQSGARVWIVPSSIDTQTWRPVEARTGNHWTIGWTGTSSNLKYLQAIEEPLADFLAEHRDTRLLVVCDRKPPFKKLPGDSWRFERWSPEAEVSSVQKMDVGLMPLPDNDWTRGKCALKMIMYLGVAIPVVASPVGVAQEIFAMAEVGIAARTENDWYEGLKRLYHDSESSKRLGVTGRKLVEEKFSVRANAPKLAAIIREVAG
jgi:glycosyltransferase involved in cell wall biosynthesis